MADDGDNVGRHPTTKDAPVLPKIKSEYPLRHDADAWVKVAKNNLGPLLAVAEGQTPGSARRIIDIDLRSIPELPVDHRDYERRNEVRLRTRLQNEKNQLDRFHITMQERTTVFTALSAATEKGAPVLFETLQQRFAGQRVMLSFKQLMDAGYIARVRIFEVVVPLPPAWEKKLAAGGLTAYEKTLHNILSPRLVEQARALTLPSA